MIILSVSNSLDLDQTPLVYKDYQQAISRQKSELAHFNELTVTSFLA